MGVGFTISKNERAVLQHLSLFVFSYGRYPLTKKAGNAPLRPNEHGVMHWVSWNNDDHAVAEQTIARLSE